MYRAASKGVVSGIASGNAFSFLKAIEVLEKQYPTYVRTWATAVDLHAFELYNTGDAFSFFKVVHTSGKQYPRMQALEADGMHDVCHITS